ncbi:MAG TPA: HD domain-containing protein [Solirubrobacteraceae bacterium]|nr:HD domain-containing protein [Solirubrobacteraceae bacterium]
MLVRDLTDGDGVALALLVRDCSRGTARNGSDFLRLVLGDRSGTLPARLWDCSDDHAALAVTGAVVHVTGRFEVHERYGGQLLVRELRPAQPGEYDLADLLDAPQQDAATMEGRLRNLISTVQDPDLLRLLDALLGPASVVWAEYLAAPAAKRYHQAYRHGLLEHSLSVAEAVSAISAGDMFPGLDRDVAVTGALLHAIGTIEADGFAGAAIEMTDAGRLQGEIPLGYYRVRRAIEELEGFPPARAEAILHIILSHHGALEHGSPVVPCTREATLVHMIDNLGGRLGSFDRLEKELPDGARWSGFDHALSSSAYFAARAAA